MADVTAIGEVLSLTVQGEDEDATIEFDRDTINKNYTAFNAIMILCTLEIQFGSTSSHLTICPFSTI